MKSIGSNGFGNGQFNGPMGIAFNSKIHLFVVDIVNHRIVEYVENMQFVRVFGSQENENGRFQHPRGIADDSIVVIGYRNHRIQIFSKDGNCKQMIGEQGSGNGEFYYPWDVAVCKTSGRIFVSEDNHCVQVFSRNGKFLFKFGSKGSENRQLQYPCGLALSNCGQYLFVFDWSNHRIQPFNAMNGAFVVQMAQVIINLNIQLEYAFHHLVKSLSVKLATN
jgi:DNA-binding beta-propeller fold protein YncE